MNKMILSPILHTYFCRVYFCLRVRVFRDVQLCNLMKIDFHALHTLFSLEFVIKNLLKIQNSHFPKKKMVIFWRSAPIQYWKPFKTPKVEHNCEPLLKLLRGQQLVFIPGFSNNRCCGLNVWFFKRSGCNILQTNFWWKIFHIN